ncbi:hypothetical protein [Halanaeroarchaeum sp. HSR-CO]|uniref:hypothetical protein n=1 Tax=Halanaeroarchaeum sp. HSR-CO TaxID=2866382 RepID=UPI00217D79B8|nr:hypothetical protein [Halanaeroarchaeum sp. HSR-CO]
MPPESAIAGHLHSGLFTARSRHSTVLGEAPSAAVKKSVQMARHAWVHNPGVAASPTLLASVHNTPD